MAVYQHMASIAKKTEHPLLLVSYDRAMASLDSFLHDAARFAGVIRFDVETVIAGIREDGQRYFKTGSEKVSPPAPIGVLDQPKPKAPRAPGNVPFSYL